MEALIVWLYLVSAVIAGVLLAPMLEAALSCVTRRMAEGIVRLWK